MKTVILVLILLFLLFNLASPAPVSTVDSKDCQRDPLLCSTRDEEDPANVVQKFDHDKESNSWWLVFVWFVRDVRKAFSG